MVSMSTGFCFHVPPLGSILFQLRAQGGFMRRFDKIIRTKCCENRKVVKKSFQNKPIIKKHIDHLVQGNLDCVMHNHQQCRPGVYTFKPSRHNARLTPFFKKKPTVCDENLEQKKQNAQHFKKMMGIALLPRAAKQNLLNVL